jgi:hypothetical protein
MNTENTAAPVVSAVAEAVKKATRTQAFSRTFGTFDGPLILTPEGEVAKQGVKPLSYNAAEIPGFNAIPKGARVVLLRGIADQLTQTFAAVLRPSKDEPEGRSIAEAIDEMNDVFSSIVEGTFTYGRTGTGAGRVQGVALTAALMVAVNYGLADRAAAMAHPHYVAIKERLQAMLAQAEEHANKAEAIAIPEVIEGDEASKAAAEEATKAQDVEEANATALRSAYMQLAKEPSIAALRNTWYPPKAKEAQPNAPTIASLFANLA